MPRILLVGPYERDNFGDLLFLLVTEHYLRQADVVAAAPFSADMTALLDRDVPAYAPLLREEAFDVIWTVGGQVGAVDLRRAYRMSAHPDDYQRFLAANRLRRDRTLRRATGAARLVSPYIPSPAQFPRNAGAVSVINSAGLSGAAGVPDRRRRALESVLATTDRITVRDPASASYLEGLGIEHRMAPDAVHALGVLRPAARDRDSDVAVVQVSAGMLAKLGHAAVADALAATPELRDLRVRLLLAGAATGHDSVEDYEQLARLLRERVRNADVAIVGDRRPYDLVDRIRGARVVIGSSLHVRIAAAAYAVPRVTLARAKATRYARTWDRHMPYGVTLPELPEAVNRALAVADEPDVVAHAREIARRADAQLQRLTAEVLECSALGDREARAAHRREHTVRYRPRRPRLDAFTSA